MLFLDQLNREIHLVKKPERIICLVPSVTELLYDLGLKEQIVGQTIFCIHPQQYFKNSTKIGGTKKLQLEKIRSLKPDLIIANKEENDKDQIEQLIEEFPVWISDISTLGEALEMINSLGKITGSVKEANEILTKIYQQLTFFRKEKLEKRKVLYLIWKEPYIAVGRNTFIDAMLEEAGFENVVSTERYPEISEMEIHNLNPDLIFLSSEPFPFKAEHAINLDKLIGCKKSVLVDGEMFSWYGSRMLKSFDYFKELQYQMR